MTDACVKNYAAPPVRRKEILRYAGIGEEGEDTRALIDECLKEAEGCLSFRVVYKTLPCAVAGSAVTLGGVTVNSASLAKNLAGCDTAVLFAATVGAGIDRLIARAGALSPAKALVFQALGAERVESLADVFNAEVRAEHAPLVARPRFSPGYGDFPLAFQKDVFRLLSPEKIGIALGTTLLMTPSKSVTAVIGFSDTGVCP